MQVARKVFAFRAQVILGALLLMGSGSLGWIDRPVAGWLTGNRIGLSEVLPSGISYGSVCLAMGLLSLVGLVRRVRWASFFAGVVSLMVVLNFVLGFSVFHSSDLAVIDDLNRQAEEIFSFGKYLPPNRGAEPTFDERLKVDGVVDRFYATLHFATFGWYASILGALFLLVGSIKSIASKGTRIIALLLCAGLVVGYSLVSVLPYLRAEYHQNKGYYYIAHGLYQEAVQEYMLARKLDSNLNHMKEFHAELGKAYFLMGKNDA